MTYVDGMIAPIKAGRRADYEQATRAMGPLFLEHGALHVFESVGGSDVPEGRQTDLWRAVAADRAGGEEIVFSWVVWPSKAARDKGWEAAMADPRMQQQEDQPLDMQRMIFGGFETVYDSREG